MTNWAVISFIVYESVALFLLGSVERRNLNVLNNNLRLEAAEDGRESEQTLEQVWGESEQRKKRYIGKGNGKTNFKLNMYLQKCCLCIWCVEHRSRISFINRDLPWRFFVSNLWPDLQTQQQTYRRVSFSRGIRWLRFAHLQSSHRGGFEKCSNADKDRVRKNKE